jgi:hypothetical protein
MIQVRKIKIDGLIDATIGMLAMKKNISYDQIIVDALCGNVEFAAEMDMIRNLPEDPPAQFGSKKK